MRSVLRFDGGEFHPNFKLNQELRTQGTLNTELERLARLAALGAREVAVRAAYDTGDYYSSIHGGLGANRRGLPVGRVSSTDFKAWWIERGYRTIRGEGSGGRGSRVRIRNLGADADLGFVRGKNVLRRGARSAGLTVRQRRNGRAAPGQGGL